MRLQIDPQILEKFPTARRSVILGFFEALNNDELVELFDRYLDDNKKDKCMLNYGEKGDVFVGAPVHNDVDMGPIGNNYIRTIGEPILYDKIKKYVEPYDQFVENVWDGEKEGPKPEGLNCTWKDWYIMSTGLGGETGEALEKLKKFIRDENIDIELVTKELGDILYYMTKIGHEFGISLGDIINTNVKKLSKRVKDGTMHGNGDER